MIRRPDGSRRGRRGRRGPGRRPPWRKGLPVGVTVVIGILCISGRRSRCYEDGKNEEDANELDKDIAEHCNVGCASGVRQDSGEGIEVD